MEKEKARKNYIALETATEQAMKDFNERDVLLDSVPEFDEFGTPRRLILEQMMDLQIKAMQGQLALPLDAIEAVTNTSAAVPSLTGNVLPILRRFYAEEIAFDLVTNQPMTGPTGLAIWMNERYGTDQAGGAPDAIASQDRMDVGGNFSYTYSDEASEGANATDIYIDTSQAALATSTKKIRTNATIQTLQDFNATIGVRYDSASTQLMANVLRREVGGVLIKDLFNNAIGNVNWAAQGTLVTTYVDQAAWKKTIIDAVIDAQHLVYDATYKMPNILVASPSFWKYFKKAVADDFVVNPKLAGNPNAIYGRYYAGMTTDGLRCYVDPTIITANKGMVLYRGSEPMDASGIYAPYIPLWLTPADFNTTTGNYSRLALSRYGVLNQANATGETWVNGSTVLNKNMVATITITAS